MDVAVSDVIMNECAGERNECAIGALASLASLITCKCNYECSYVSHPALISETSVRYKLTGAVET